MVPKTVLLILHVLGVVCGVGGVLMLDVHLLRLLKGARIGRHDVRFTRFVSGFVKAGLIVVWLSGLAVIGIAPDGPAAVLANPKLQAKLVVVVVLTINALFIETLALPLIDRNVGRPLFDGVGQVRRSVILGCGAVSTLSWSYPVVLGLARELNGVTPARLILTYYVSVLACMAAAMQVAGRLFYRPVSGTPASDSRPAPASTILSARPSLAESGDPVTDRTAAGREGGSARRPTGDGPVAARQAGRSALDEDTSAQRVARAFDALGTEQERQQFREGLFAALRDRLGRHRTAEELMSLVAGDALARGKIAAVAPHGAARRAFDANMDRCAGSADPGTWSEVQNWHEGLMNLSAQAVPSSGDAAPTELRPTDEPSPSGWRDIRSAHAAAG